MPTLYGDPKTKQVVKHVVPLCEVCSQRYMAGAGKDLRDGGKIKCWFCMFPRP